MQVRLSAAMEAGHQAVPEGNNALALVAVTAAAAAGGGAAKEPAGLPCPRCECTDTKFCYYNNYNLGQPRHFCKGCRRYWTRGGALRNVPVGGGTRRPSPAARRKRASANSSSSTAPSSTAPPAPLSVSAPATYATVQPYDLPPFMPALQALPLTAGDPERRLLDHNRRLLDPDRRLLDLGGSFTSLLAPAPAPDGHFFSTGFLLGGLPPMTLPPASSAPALLPPRPPASSSQAPFPEGLIWGMGWPDLSI